MMKSAATLAPVEAHAGQAMPQPIVFVDGVPEPRLGVTRWTAEAPLDTRTVTFDATAAATRPQLLRRWQDAHIMVAQPLRLADEQVRWQVLAEGVIGEGERTSAAGRERREMTLRDSWSATLARRLAQTWWSQGDATLVAQPGGRLLAGQPGNRSHRPFRFAGRDVFVLREPGSPWTVGEALTTVAAWADLGFSFHLLPREARRLPLSRSVDLTLPLGDILRHLLEPYDLVLQREIIREGERLIERRCVRPATHSRVVHLPEPATEAMVGHATAVAGGVPVAAAEPWVARAAGWRVESTFDLVPGWHPALAGESAAAYDRGASDDFARYANVYRYWVLNEDGRFTAPPYDRGPAFDIASLFGEGELRAQALPFGPCVTLDDAGEPRPPVVEVSIDSGETWQQYPGKVRMAEHRAAVYLDDDALPAGLFDAAQAGAARVRVTASLQSPRPVEVTRWRGNPFAGTRPPRVFEVGEAFRFQRVAETSIHKPAIVAGELEARESNPRAAMRQWLVERLHDGAAAGGANAGSVRWTWAGLWLAVRPGDRLRPADGAAASAGLAAGRVRRVRARFDRTVTELELQPS